MVLEGEQRQTHVGEDEILRKEVDEFEEVFGPPSRLFREIYEGIVGLHYPAEEYCHNTWGEGGKERICRLF